MTLLDLPVPTKGLILVFGEPGSGKNACVTRALEYSAKSEGVDLTLYDNLSLPVSQTRSTFDLNEGLAEKIFLESRQRLVVLVAQAADDYTSGFRDFLFRNADVLIVLRNNDSFLQGILDRQRYKMFGFLPRKFPAAQKFVIATAGKCEAAILRRFKRSVNEVFPNSKWHHARFVSLPVIDQQSRTPQSAPPMR